MPNKNFVSECFPRGKNFVASGASTAKGKSDGNTFNAQTVTPSKKLCMYIFGALKNTAKVAANSIVTGILAYFTTLVYLFQLPIYAIAVCVISGASRVKKALGKFLFFPSALFFV